jgi:hypothetical protein
MLSLPLVCPFHCARHLYIYSIHSPATAWAHAEPPSPTDDASESVKDPRPSDATSHQLAPTIAGSTPSQWSVFAASVKKPPPPLPPPPPRRPAVKKSLSLRQRSMSWLSSSMRSHRDPLFTEKNTDLHASPIAEDAPDSTVQGSADLVRSPRAWDPRSRPRTNSPESFTRDQAMELDSDEDEHDVNIDPTVWCRRKRQFRAFILSNTYIPLVSLKCFLFLFGELNLSSDPFSFSASSTPH